MSIANLFNGPAAAIVFGGTALATLLRCGLHDAGLTVRTVAGLGRSHFDADSVRAELARQVQDIRRDGLLRAEPHTMGDREFDEATEALLERRSVSALLERHEAHKARRQAVNRIAVRTLAEGAELAPVFGLAGTLISLSQLPADGLARGLFTGAISLAVLTTLYGLLTANLLLAPLSRWIDRQARDEEAARQEAVDWIARQIDRPDGQPA